MESSISERKPVNEAISYFEGLLEKVATSPDSHKEILRELSQLSQHPDLVGKKLNNRLNNSFYQAVMLQYDVIKMRDAYESLSDEERNAYEAAKTRADEIAMLVFAEGYERTVLSEFAGKRVRAISGEDHKVLQAKTALEASKNAEDPLMFEAVSSYVEATPLAEIIENNPTPTDKSDRSGRLASFGKKAMLTLSLSTVTLGATAGMAAAAEDDPSKKPYLPDEDAQERARSDVLQHNGEKPVTLTRTAEKTPKSYGPSIKLVEPKLAVVAPPKRVEIPPPPTRSPITTIKLAAPPAEVFIPPQRIEVAPVPKPDNPVILIPNVPIAPSPENPAPAIVPPAAPDKAPTTPIPDVIVDPNLHGETMWTAGQLEHIRNNLPVYLEVQTETGVPWEVMAALHAREFGLKVENPSNGQGIYQLYSTGEYFAPGAVSREEFKHQTILAANFLLGKARDNSRVGGPMDFTNPDKIKDALFAYNGLASDYFKQAARLGFALGAEGSPYVMNMADDRRNSDLNSNWGQILHDNGALGKANRQPGAWPLIEGLRKINTIARDQMAAKQAAEAVAATEAARVAAEAAAEAARIAEQTRSNGILAGWPNDGEAAMKLFNQCDPSWGEIRTPLGIRACEVSCGPTSVAMAVNALTGKPVNPGEVIQFTNNNRMWLAGDRGTSFDGVIKLGKNFGINGRQLQNFKDINAYKEVLQSGGMILVAGSGPVPFVTAPEAHFVLIRGMTTDGKFLVADPYPKTPDTNTKSWDANQIINGTFGAVVFTK
jgi:hypothetical protein